MSANPAAFAAPHEAFKGVFARNLSDLPGPIASLREAKFQSFLQTGIPTAKAEAFKYTNLAGLINKPMRLAVPAQVPSEDLYSCFAGGPTARRIIFVNGHLDRKLTHCGNLQLGVSIEPIAERLHEKLALSYLENLDDRRSLTDLNTALASQGVMIDIDDGVKVDHPIQLLFLTVGSGHAEMQHPRVIARLGKGASLHLIESHIGITDGLSFVNLVSQFDLAEDAQLTHDRYQQLRPGEILVSKSDVQLKEHARFDQTLVSLGGDVIRNENEVRLKGSHANCTLNGCFMPSAKEHVDNLIHVHHEQPDCESNQWYKGVMDGYAKGVFAGKIFVHQDAQRTNAYQTNNNLLLSENAEIDTKPELEIYADDVKCSHGATCGELDADSLFYLKSRGIPADLAQSLLIYAFAAEIVERFQDDHIRAAARSAIVSRMPGGSMIEDML